MPQDGVRIEELPDGGEIGAADMVLVSRNGSAMHAQATPIGNDTIDYIFAQVWGG